MHRSPFVRSLVALGCFAGLSVALAFADNWPTWRGPENDGISKETKLPTDWSESKNILWKLPMPGIGSSTPIIWGDRIFFTSSDGKDLVLLCISTEGKQLWKSRIATTNAKGLVRGDETSEASASCNTDGKHVWSFVGTGDLACHDFAGKEIWTTNIQQRYGKYSIQHGIHSTPLLHEDRLYLAILHNNGHYLLALDKMTGKEVFKHVRPTDAKGESREAYTTPVLWNDGKEKQIVIVGCDYVTGHRITDGSEVWRVGGINLKNANSFRIIASPVASSDLLVAPTARGELVVALKPGGQGKIAPGSPFEMWRKAKGAPDVPSPLIHDGLVYLCRENGVLLCWEAKTGKELYSGRLHNDRYRASPVYADGKIYLASRDGTFSVVKAGAKFEKLAENRIEDTFTANPAIADGRIYLRGFKTLYAVKEGAK